MYDVIVIGSGPAGLAAGIYAARNKIKTLLLSQSQAGYPAMASLSLVSFENLKKEFEEALLENKEFLERKLGEEVTSLEKNVVSFSVEIKSGQLYYAKAVIIASGHNDKTSGGNSSFDLLTLKNSSERIKVKANMSTNIKGLFAAGGVTERTRGDVFISAAEGARAALSAIEFLNTK
jgi:thioredoxin reductase (NADPH)